MNSVQKETIKLYAKQLRVPTFNNYDKVIRQLSADDGYEQFLIELMKQELAERSVTGQKRRIKAAKFPSLKTLDEFDMSDFGFEDDAEDEKTENKESKANDSEIYQVIIDCENKFEQAEIFEQLKDEGYKCHTLTT